MDKTAPNTCNIDRDSGGVPFHEHDHTKSTMTSDSLVLKNCATCRFSEYLAFGGGSYECRRRAPVFVESQMHPNRFTDGVWPNTGAAHDPRWCGEWEPRE